MDAGIIVGALAGGAILRALQPLARFNMTSKGLNLYTFKAALNVLAHHRFWEHAQQVIGARITSAYRSPGVNKAVGGVATSDHVKGLACDFVPQGDKQQAVKKLRAACAQGELGPVRQFIWESYKNVIHVGYYEPGKTGGVQYLEQYGPGQHRPLVTS
ncbi:MAG: D-Ala-D-Ala carboxypeptidase family metallohydrolase [Bacteroidales bacterium]|jgi:hypothetical protein|nr:D-Ala-D-Ala carboxypeptidase family metallohydrolase [Bacteroidales bacterium]